MTRKEIPHIAMFLLAVLSFAMFFLGAEHRLASGLNVSMKISLALAYSNALLQLFGLYLKASRSSVRTQDVLFVACFVMFALGASLSGMSLIK